MQPSKFSRSFVHLNKRPKNMKYFRFRKYLKPFLPNAGLKRKFYGPSSQNVRLKKRVKLFLPNAHLRRKVFGTSYSQKRPMKRLTLGMPVTYRIRVQGFLEKRWVERLGDMHISYRGRKDQAPVSILIVRLRDQAELMGVLNSLYELHLPIITIEYIEENNGINEKRQDSNK
jgi:hypothetical protein